MTPNLSCLPTELHNVIFESCEQHDLLSLAQSSKALFLRTVPLIYRYVDLSTHNREPDFTGERDQWADVHPLRPPPVTMIHRQHSFLLNLLRYPEHGKYVRHLTWTLTFASDIKGEGNHLLTEDILQVPETKIWEAFENMANVQKLDLASLHGCCTPYLMQCPSSLFSSAVSIRLLGRFPFRLASAILHSVDATKLQQLCLDDVQDWGQRADGTPMPLSEGYCLVGKEEHKTPDGSRGIVFPGPMRGLLPLLEGRCLSLTSLFLRKAGQMYRSNMRMRYWSAAADEEVYSEWAAFIESVRPTLEVLVIEQGTSSMVQRPNRISGPGRPMDIRFTRFVVPSLASGGWSSLQRMELRGTGVEKRPQRRENLAAIQGAIGPSAELVIIPWARKPCPKFNGFDSVPDFGQEYDLFS
jgi:hypothetical protein